MASSYKTPGVYVEEIRKFPPSVAQVETAIPAFIGYTHHARLRTEGDLRDRPFRIKSLLEYERYFGDGANEQGITVTINTNADNEILDVFGEINNPSPYLMYYSLRAFFANGGGPCYIVSVGDYSNPIDAGDLERGLDEVAKVDEVTLILFPDGLGLSNANNYYGLQKAALDQCELLQDRFTVMDIYMADDADTPDANITAFRNYDFGTVDTSKYGACYYPRVFTTYDYDYDIADVMVNHVGGNDAMNGPLADLEGTFNAAFNQAKTAVNDIEMLLPPSSSVVGVYASVDSSRGVWKAPANVGIDFAVRPEIQISNEDQEVLNVDVTSGKSINAIRSFVGRGPALIWGARTLAGNDNEWRYISVRRFFNMVEESVKKASGQFVFEPNDANTWITIRSMIENFLTLQWRAGALQGATPEQAFYVKVGLDQTMSAIDILEGRMIVEIGMAVVRPAEFIILKFSHKMVES
ncbi:MAG: phage tail sheath C-terminal domain-containing protein [Bacteroidota bacterium]